MITFMKEVSIILPKQDNNGIEISWEAQLYKVAEVLGGYTVAEVHGGWVDNGVLYKDDSLMLTMNFEKMTEDILTLINDLIRDLFTTQLAIFIKLPQGSVIFDKSQHAEVSNALREI